jgi:hypothetical protein
VLVTFETEDGRIFELRCALPYVRRDGTLSSVAHWRGACRQCGAPFEVTTSGNLASLLSTRCFTVVHCQAHRLTRGRKVTPQQSEGGADLPDGRGASNL